MSADVVLRVNEVEEETRFLCAVHQVIAGVLAAKDGRTLIDISESIGCEVKTISNAFNRKHRLSQVFLTRIGQAYGPHALNPIAKLSGGRMVPLEAEETDALPSLTGAVHRLAVAKSSNSAGGEGITHTELLGMEPDIDAAIRALTALKDRCDRLRNAA